MEMKDRGRHREKWARAIERLRAGHHYDLILCDLGMPDMNGWRVAREIRTSPRHHGLHADGLGADRRRRPAQEVGEGRSADVLQHMRDLW